MASQLISFNLGADWVGKLWRHLQAIRNKRKKELEEINRIMFGNPMDLARYYVEPKCQEMNPADRAEEDLLVSREPIMRKIDQFFQAKALSHQGGNQLIVLADAGMGKSALLTMLKLLHLTSFWPRDKECILKKLGPQTVTQIRNIPNQFETILLLDSLDEDPRSYGRMKKRLLEILEATQHFHRVIITCRTQFFPNTQSDPFERPGIITIDGFVCPTKYISFFDDQQVEEYLKKRFPRRFGILPQTKIREEAQKVVNKMGSLRCRPMLLAYIEDLMASPTLNTNSSEYSIYKALVESWLLREEAKKFINAAALFHACQLLATVLTLEHKRSISEKRLDVLVDDLPEIKEVRNVDIKGRSLLNRNSDGDYRFSHFSFQEFLVAHRLLQDTDWKPDQPIPSGDFLLRLLFGTRGALRMNAHVIRLLDLTGAMFQDSDLSELDLTNAQLNDANLSHSNLSRAMLARATLENANLSHAILIDAVLQDATLSKADLTEAKLNGANLRKLNLTGATLRRADLSNTDLMGSTLEGANLYSAVLSGANLEGANLSNAVLTWAVIEGASLSNANLSGANLEGANLSNTDLVGARLENANLSKATLTNANLKRANLTNLNLTGAVLQNVDLSNVDLKRIYLKEANLSGAKLSFRNLDGVDWQGVNLTNSDLTNANLQHGNLSAGDLTDANLKSANLYSAKLTGAKLIRGNLSNANLAGAKLEKTDLSFAKLVTAKLERADLSNAVLTSASLEGATLLGTNLTGANLMDASLTGANLENAVLTGANLENANLSFARLVAARLEKANLSNANLTGATLSNANLTGANLLGADLTNTDLTDARLVDADLSRAILTAAQFENADFSGANVTGVTFPGKDTSDLDG